MATFQKKVFTGLAAALLTLGSTGLNAAEGAPESGAGGGARAGGAAGALSVATAVTLGVVGLGLIVVAGDGDSGSTTFVRPPVNPPSSPTTTTTTTTTTGT